MQSTRATTFNDTWAYLQPRLETVFSGEKIGTSLSREEYMLCISKVLEYCSTRNQVGTQPGAHLNGQELYEHLREFVHTRCRAAARPLMSLTGDQLLAHYNSTWELYSFSSGVFNNVCNYLNRFWIPRQNDEGRPTLFLHKLALAAWRDCVFLPFQQQIIDAILTLIATDRRGETVVTRLISVAAQSFIALDDANTPRSSVYQTIFQPRLISETEQFYARESGEFLAHNPVTEYLKKVEVRMSEEKLRIDYYLHSSSRQPLIAQCMATLIRSHAATMHAEITALLAADRRDDLKRLYTQLGSIEELGPLRVDLEAHIVARGRSAIEGVAEAVLKDEDAKVYVETMLDIYHRYLDLVENWFSRDVTLMTALDKACKTFINDNSVTRANRATAASKTPELLAKHCDSMLKKGGVVLAEDELETQLNNALIIFKYLDDRDVFQKFYSKLLAKRLVYAASASDYSESSMISKLKVMCGYEYTSKLQRMFNDVGISKDVNAKYREYALSVGRPKVEYYTMVLTNGSWPFQSSHNIILPAELEAYKEHFAQHYRDTNNGRRLQWLPHMCKGELRTSCFKQPFVFQASTVQIAVLMQYNTNLGYTLDELCGSTGVPQDVMKANLEVLVKMKILLQPDPAKESYELNTGYKYKKLRVKIDLPIKLEQKVDVEQTLQAVEEDRSMLMQATIVRIMKMRKELAHNDLLTETINQLSTRFSPKIALIKKAIDVLIEKEYLRRPEGTRDRYAYIA